MTPLSNSIRIDLTGGIQVLSLIPSLPLTLRTQITSDPKGEYIVVEITPYCPPYNPSPTGEGYHASPSILDRPLSMVVKNNRIPDPTGKLKE